MNDCLFVVIKYLTSAEMYIAVHIGHVSYVDYGKLQVFLQATSRFAPSRSTWYEIYRAADWYESDGAHYFAPSLLYQSLGI